MGHGYRAVGWNRQKIIYDVTLAAGLVAYLGTFAGLFLLARPHATIETVLIRALGSAAFLLLCVVLAIGPLCRISPAFLPLLYNRRHLGVTTFLVALAHAGFALVHFHGRGDVDPLSSLLVSNTRYGSLADFPFEILGLAALLVLLLLAATSHDFWLAQLTPPVWKSLHMAVYAAWALVVLHITLGVLQDETSPVLIALVASGPAVVLALHLVAARRERRSDGADEPGDGAQKAWVEICAPAEIPEKGARVVTLGGERVAVFRYDGKISALSNVCRHQNGPLGEGRIVDGCVTCPWHGYQYLPDSGTAPPPFVERVPTFNVRIDGGRVWVDPRPNPPGTRVEPARLAGG